MEIVRSFLENEPLAFNDCDNTSISKEILDELQDKVIEDIAKDEDIVSILSPRGRKTLSKVLKRKREREEVSVSIPSLTIDESLLCEISPSALNMKVDDLTHMMKDILDEYSDLKDKYEELTNYKYYGVKSLSYIHLVKKNGDTIYFSPELFSSLMNDIFIWVIYILEFPVEVYSLTCEYIRRFIYNVNIYYLRTSKVNVIKLRRLGEIVCYALINACRSIIPDCCIEEHVPRSVTDLSLLNLDMNSLLNNCLQFGVGEFIEYEVKFTSSMKVPTEMDFFWLYNSISPVPHLIIRDSDNNSSRHVKERYQLAWSSLVYMLDLFNKEYDIAYIPPQLKASFIWRICHYILTTLEYKLSMNNSLVEWFTPLSNYPDIEDKEFKSLNDVFPSVEKYKYRLKAYTHTVDAFYTRNLVWEDYFQDKFFNALSLSEKPKSILPDRCKVIYDLNICLLSAIMRNIHTTEKVNEDIEDYKHTKPIEIYY